MGALCDAEMRGQESTMPQRKQHVLLWTETVAKKDNEKGEMKTETTLEMEFVQCKGPM